MQESRRKSQQGISIRLLTKSSLRNDVADGILFESSEFYVAVPLSLLLATNAAMKQG